MKILDRYILGRVIFPLALIFLAFVGIFVIVDLFDHVHTFIDNSVPIPIVGLYYFYYLPLIVVLTTPIAMLLATMLSLGRLSKRNEIMALKGSGVTVYRILAPVLVLAALLSAANLFIGETLVPPATRRRIEIEDDYIKRRTERVIKSDVIYVRPDGTTFLARRFNVRRQTAEEVTVEEFDSELRPTSRIDARTATWEDDHWVFYDGRLRRFTVEGENATSFDTLDLPYSEPTPSDLARRRLEPEEMGSRELRSYIARLRSSGSGSRELDVELRLKFSFPLVTLIMTLLGAPLAIGARRTGFAISFAAALAISFLYYGLIQVGGVLGREGVLPPIVSAWIANVLFAAIGAAILARTPK